MGEPRDPVSAVEVTYDHGGIEPTERMRQAVVDAVVEEVSAAQRVGALLALLAEAREELDKWGYGDMHYGNTPRDAGVLRMLAKIDAALRASQPMKGDETPGA